MIHFHIKNVFHFSVFQHLFVDGTQHSGNIWTPITQADNTQWTDIINYKHTYSDCCVVTIYHIDIFLYLYRHYWPWTVVGSPWHGEYNIFTKSNWYVLVAFHSIPFWIGCSLSFRYGNVIFVHIHFGLDAGWYGWHESRRHHHHLRFSF